MPGTVSHSPENARTSARSNGRSASSASKSRTCRSGGGFSLSASGSSSSSATKTASAGSRFCSVGSLTEEGNFEQAQGDVGAGGGDLQRLGKRWEAANAEVAAAYACIGAGDRPAARRRLERTLRVATELESRPLAAESLAALGIVRAEGTPRPRRACSPPHRRSPTKAGILSTSQFERGVFEGGLRDIRDDLAERFEREWESGKALTLEEAVALALEQER